MLGKRYVTRRKRRLMIARNLAEEGWIIQDLNQMYLFASLGVAVRKFLTSAGKADYDIVLSYGG